MKKFDVVILGAGGAGLMCAIHAGKRGRSIAILDHSKKPGGKIIISGGGRCNFTNLGASFKQYVSENEHFCKSALSRYLPENFIEMVNNHNIAFHERKHGQLFCDSSAQQLIDMLVKEGLEVGVQLFLEHKILSIQKEYSGYIILCENETFQCESLVVATGGLSIPKIGATGFGYQVAKQFGLQVTSLEPALDGFVFDQKECADLEGFAGIALEVEMQCKSIRFTENLLFTHVGLSGPVALQVSLHWNKGDSVSINFVPQLSSTALQEWFLERKKSKLEIKNLISELVPKRLAERFCDLYLPADTKLANLSKKHLDLLCEKLQCFTFVPKSTVGYSKAEVTRGGVDTNELSSKTMEAKKAPGLYFIGEVVDVSGWLGGYNYQWAWASGWAAGQAV